MAEIIPLFMSASDVTNQQLYELIQSLQINQKGMGEELSKTREELRQQFALVHQRLDFHDQHLQDLMDFRREAKEDAASLRQDVKELGQETTETFAILRKAVAALQDTRLRWNGGILAWVTLASSALTLILLRLLNTVGLRIVEGGGVLV